MSKIDAQRAMWKQRYERRQAAAAAQPSSAAPRHPWPRPRARDASPRPGRWRREQAATEQSSARAAEAEQAAPEQTEPAEELCGHRNIGGRTCTRERGHAAKSHRYS